MTFVIKQLPEAANVSVATAELVTFSVKFEESVELNVHVAYESDCILGSEDDIVPERAANCNITNLV